MELKVKDVREALEETLGKFYADADFSVGSTKVMDGTHEFRIEFRIYDSEFWMNIGPAIYCVHIATRSFGEPDHLDILHIWLRPYRYDKEHFTFGWRKDLECLFDAFEASLRERVEKMQKTDAASVYGSSASGAEIGEDKVGGTVLAAGDGQLGGAVIAAILNGLDDKSKQLKAKDAEAKETKTSIFNGLKEDKEEEDEYI